MTSRMKLPLCLALVSIALGYSVLEYGGVVRSDWNIALLLIGLAGIISRAPHIKTAKESWPWALLLPAYVGVQLLPLPSVLVRILSPVRAAILDTLGSLTHPIGFAALSVSPETTFEFLFRVIGYTLTFLLVLNIARNSAQRRRWLPVIPLIAIAAIEAAAGLWQHVQGGDVEGTYANRNHLAGLLEMVLPLSLAYGFALIRDARSTRSSPVRCLLAACVVLALSLFVFGALLATLSKMGFTAGLAGVFMMGAVAILTGLRGWHRWLALGCALTLLLFVFVFLPPDELVAGFAGIFSGQQPAAEGRVPIGRDTLHLISSYPLLGSGLGTYGTAFLKYQTSVVDFDFMYAHDDYLQLAAELGIVGFLLLALVGLPVVARAFRASRHGDPDTRYLGLGCVGGFTAIGLHSLADFNLYIPANALVLAWIAAIAASLAPRPKARAVPILGASSSLILASLLVVYAPAWILFDSQFRSDARAEAVFCHIGICDTSAVMTAQALDHGGIANVPAAQLLKALRRGSNDPSRWCDAGEAFSRSGQAARARLCFSEAVALGPNIPPVRFRSADFYYGIHETGRALAERSHVLGITETYDNQIFGWYDVKKLPVADILAHGLPQDQRAYQAYLRYLIGAERVRDASDVWRSVSSHHYADDRLAAEYVRLLFNEQMYEPAARAWADYLGDRLHGYLDSAWIFNGDFESEPSGSAFDWRIDKRDGVEVTRDASVEHTGAHSLRIRFSGQGNVDYGQISQTAFVKPGLYRFEAFIRTENITTDEGIGFHIFDPDATGRTNVFTERFTGTNPWSRVEAMIPVATGTKLLEIQIVRRPSLKFDSNIAGTAWIDGVQLTVAGDSAWRQTRGPVPNRRPGRGAK